MKKLKFLVVIVLFFAGGSLCFAKDVKQSDSQLYNEIVYTFNTGFYSGAIEKIEQLNKNFPDSEFCEDSEFIKGQSLYYLKRYSKALNVFYSICKNADSEYYSKSVLYAGRSYFQMQDFSKAIPLFEYIVTHGSQYEKSDYVESLQKLFVSYNNTGNKDKTQHLLNNFSEEDFGPELYEELKSEPDSIHADFYKAKKLCEEKNYTEAEQVLIMLLANRARKPEKFEDACYALLIRCYAMDGQWNKISDCYKKIQEPNNNVIYFAAFASYFTGDFDSVVELLKGKIYLRDLYNVSLAKILFKQKKYDESLKVSSTLKMPEAMYLSGLNCINLKNWKKAKNYFENYLKTEPADLFMCWFYKGYAEYCSGDFQAAYNSLSCFLNDAKLSDYQKYERKACEFALYSGVNSGSKEKVYSVLDRILALVGNEKQKQADVMLACGLYSDFGDYDKAIAILEPYSKKSDLFSLTAVYNMGLIREKQADYTGALSLYEFLYSQKSDSKEGENALYRAAQINFNSKNYQTAEELFNRYVYQYTSGENTEAALFYCGESLIYNDKLERALMMTRMLIQKYPDSAYSYGAYRNLLKIYYELEQYSEAYDASIYLTKNYPAQVNSDGIIEKQRELKKLLSGADKEIAKKYAEYVKYGIASVKGRIAGTELVQLYMKSETTRKEAYNLAIELVENQNEAEAFYAAQNMEAIARCLQINKEYAKAAERYLKAAELYRTGYDETENVISGVDDEGSGTVKPAQMLYAAVECFIGDDLFADADETAKLLVQLYPNTKQAQRVETLLKNR